MAAAVGEVAGLLDVHVDQLAGPVAFVTAYDVAGCPVQVREPGKPVTGQDAVDGRGHQAERVRDAGRSPAAQDTDFDDPALGAGRCPARTVSGAAGAVAHAGLAQGTVAVGPSLGGGGRDLEAFRSPAQGPAVLDDAAGQTQATGKLHRDPAARPHHQALRRPGGGVHVDHGQREVRGASQLSGNQESPIVSGRYRRPTRATWVCWVLGPGSSWVPADAGLVRTVPEHPTPALP